VAREIDLDKYVPVNVRVQEFYNKYPEGSLQSEIVHMSEDGKQVIMRALAYRTPDDIRPGIGHAEEVNDGRNFVNRTSMIENAETSSWGRALASLGFEVQLGVASKEEMEKAISRAEELDKSKARPAAAQEKRAKKRTDSVKVFNRIKDLHEKLGVANDDSAKKALLKDSGIGDTFKGLDEEQLIAYADYIEAQLTAANEEGSNG
jgi:hypothetical protein